MNSSSVVNTPGSNKETPIRSGVATLLLQLKGKFLEYNCLK